MNIDETVRAVTEKGFTERQARFLVLVARHSGVCVMRQYSAFAGIVFGQKTRKFFAKLERLGYVSTYDCAHNRARIYHLRHRDLYEAIGDPDSRLRRPPAVPRALERLMALDAILENPDIIWLSTPDEKVAHVSALTRVPLEAMPHSKVRQGDARARSVLPRQAAGRHPSRRPLGVRLPDHRWHWRRLPRVPPAPCRTAVRTPGMDRQSRSSGAPRRVRARVPEKRLEPARVTNARASSQ